MNKKSGLIYLLMFLPFLAFAQDNKDPYQEKYEWRIRQEVLYGVYIPKDVNEALLQLNRLTDEPSKNKFKSMGEEEAVSKLFFSLGRWMSHNWGFNEGSRLTVNLRSMGIYSPDDMSRFLMTLFHRSLNKKPLELKETLKIFQEKSEAERQERLNQGTILHEETRQRPKPIDGNKGGN